MTDSSTLSSTPSSMLPPRRDERGQVSVLIVGFAAVLLLAVAVVIDSSAAYLQRQGLSTLADGAALSGADAGATGGDVYRGGVGEAPLALTPSRAEAGVRAYLADVGAYADYPGLTVEVDVDGTRILVDLSAPIDLPLAIPGAPERPRIGASGSAITDPQ